MFQKTKVWLKEKYRFIRKHTFVFFCNKVPEKKRQELYVLLVAITNYFANALLLAIPFTFFLTTNTFNNYCVNVLCIWILIPQIEHYYAWFRDGWKFK